MKLWGGRFSGEPDQLAYQFNASISIDWRLAQYDIQGSQAWGRALGQAGILTEAEAAQIISGLGKVLEEVQGDTFQLQPGDEDVHTAIERRLTEIIGPVGGKLHTGRSRNDQVITDYRLWMLAAIDQAAEDLKKVQTALLERAESDLGVILPGYTHTQRAQPVLLSHWWLAHFWALEADATRLGQMRPRVSVLPLGSGALAGTPYPIDRRQIAADLGFADISANSLHAIADRDFVAEFLFWAALCAIHLSRLADALILFSTAEFGFIELADTYSSGSSLMPQKKNPDPLELTRGKAGTLLGRLTGFLAVLKGLPSAYDKDLQEDKLPAFEASDTLAMVLPVAAGCLKTLTLHPERMRAALDPAMLATDLADYLVQKEVPFRQAHHLVGQVVRRASQLGVTMDLLPLAELQAIHPAFQPDVNLVFDFQQAVDRRSTAGGTGTQSVIEQIARAKTIL
jgi:argininosuccinate lyase